ncbi:MAG: hypothetical protein AVDCRST_MAG52-3415 [uncultured Blastococcus sp.]|uniref:Uncharacterized protein n=1 Tax=uncultured Blastococcus sp. TaxID=217144 RepID=A0A6J4JDQ6_9ACTN|nr:MAG: hypothetical protein AVDCRST_MAG52-3415 [uncultured Blastococcus sp.]
MTTEGNCANAVTAAPRCSPAGPARNGPAHLVDHVVRLATRRNAPAWERFCWWRDIDLPCAESP